MNRREFLNRSTTATLCIGLGDRLLLAPLLEKRMLAGRERAGTNLPGADEAALTGTAPLTTEGDLAIQMVDGIHRYLLHETEKQGKERVQLWSRDYTSVEHYERSVASNRERFRQMIGAVDARVAAQAPELVGSLPFPAQIAQRPLYKVYRVRWPVFAGVTADSNGLDAEGLLLQPEGPPVARVVAVPDADWTPEMLAGLIPGISPGAQFARRLAENRCEVVVPVLINRDDNFSGIPGIGMTNMPHREWIYRMAFEVGRHIIGYEVQKLLSVVDWFEIENIQRRLPIGVIGYGEGGLLALYSAAIDKRIDVTMVSGYFQAREGVWKEPIYRDVWGLIREFGDAELAGLIAPRALIIEASQGPDVSGPPAESEEHKPYACPNGELTTPHLESVKKEVDRARPFFTGLKAEGQLQLITSEGGRGQPGSEAAILAFSRSLGIGGRLLAARMTLTNDDKNYDPTLRLHRQFNQMVEFTQSLIRKSPDRRQEFWKKADASTIQRWKDSTQYHRDYIWEEVIGRISAPALPPNPRTRLILDEPKYKGYEVMLDVWPEVFAYGILLLPKDVKPGERRPVVVCQHGLEGRPTDVSDPKIDNPFYRHFGCSLANEGFITYSPQNPYIGNDNFRLIQRMGHPLKLALFSFVLGQHEQLLNWLTTLPFVDPDRIGFYGLSYGGKTAVRVPPLLKGYALSICSGDFNEWVWKTTNVLAPQSYLLTKEYDMYEFNFANIVNYADLANLMAPRPIMVERGHEDPVGVDEWVSYEYAAVRRFYDKMGIGDRTEIEYFNGPHTIHGVGTFQFLHRHLRWPG
jgi:cephalosporin-C deacetylase-like acetyl esterase